jgi:hypothetical protein
MDRSFYPGLRLRLHPGLFSTAASRLSNRKAIRSSARSSVAFLNAGYNITSLHIHVAHPVRTTPGRPDCLTLLQNDLSTQSSHNQITPKKSTT